MFSIKNFEYFDKISSKTVESKPPLNAKRYDSRNIFLQLPYTNINFMNNYKKEYKLHGEGGLIIGKPPRGKVILMDDVITSGSTINKVFNIINCSQAKLSGMIIALDRQEKDLYKKPAIKNLQNRFDFKIKSIIKLTDIILFLEQNKIVDKKILY
uniref:Phosphoribosyltransferase domain-containing protein n=1 Tax=Glossina palpalis gambiensis TaxID=67801 RepID=A0A1B0C5S6_9MUSC